MAAGDRPQGMAAGQQRQLRQAAAACCRVEMPHLQQLLHCLQHRAAMQFLQLEVAVGVSAAAGFQAGHAAVVAAAGSDGAKVPVGHLWYS